MCDLADTDWEIFIGVHSVCINHHVVWAVHRAEYEGFPFHFHSREHVVFVMIPVTGCLVQVDCTDTWCHNVQISKFSLFCLNVVLELLPYCIALRKEHWKSTSYQVIGHEQVHLFSDLSVVAVFCFL